MPSGAAFRIGYMDAESVYLSSDDDLSWGNGGDSAIGRVTEWLVRAALQNRSAKVRVKYNSELFVLPYPDSVIFVFTLIALVTSSCTLVCSNAVKLLEIM